MIYTSLSDANRVLAQLKSAFPTTELDLIPLPLGKVLMQAGILDPPFFFEAADGVQMQLVASPEEKRAARQLREESATPSRGHAKAPPACCRRYPSFTLARSSTRAKGRTPSGPSSFALLMSTRCGSSSARARRGPRSRRPTSLPSSTASAILRARRQSRSSARRWTV